MRPIFENWLIENGFDAKYTLMILDELSLWLKSSGKIILNLYDSISDPCIFSSFIENILDSNEDALVAHYDEPAIDIIRLNTNLFKMFLNDCLDKNGIDGPFNNAFNGQINENREGMYDEKLDIKVTPPINIEAINADLDFRDNFNTDIVTNKNELESNPLKDNYSNTYLNNNINSSNELSKSNDDYGFADSHELKHQDLHEIKKESDLDKLIVSNGSARDLTESNVISAISKKNNLSQNELNSEINESNLIEQPKIISNSRQKFIQWISLHKNSEFSSGKIIDCFDKTSTYLSNKKLSCDIYEIQSVNQFAKI
ncbi:MAG: hypothetical protein LBF68_02850, partial [Christensenellaceae bacterium]|nr:hypothetical protein [Christensenellaceae bacterium]